MTPEAVGITFSVTFTVTVILTLLVVTVMYTMVCHKKSSRRPAMEQRNLQEQEQFYDQVLQPKSTSSEEITIEENVAYGPIQK